MRTFDNINLSQLMAEAAAFRGELVVGEDITVTRIRSAASQLSWGALEEEVVANLVSSGASIEDAYLATKAGKIL